MNTPDLSRAQWRKSSRSGANGACVEVACLGVRVAARDSKRPDGGTLLFTPGVWSTFVTDAKNGRFNP